MLWTGTKDGRFRDLYHLDIVETLDGERFIIEWNAPGFYMASVKNPNDRRDIEPFDITIIGNYYENPNLMD